MKIIKRIVGPLVLIVHGAVHLMGAAVYLRLAEIEGLSYKTQLLQGRWDIGENGTAIFGSLWAVAAGAFIILGMIWLFRRRLPKNCLVAAAVFSLALTLLDFGSAYAGAVINGIILVLALLKPALTKPAPGWEKAG